MRKSKRALNFPTAKSESQCMLCVPETAQVVHYARDQRAVCCATRAAGRPSPPSRPRPFRSANRALVTSEHWQNAARAAGFRLRLGGGTLRFGYDSLDASLHSPLHFPRSPTTDRRLHLGKLPINLKSQWSCMLFRSRNKVRNYLFPAEWVGLYLSVRLW